MAQAGVHAQQNTSARRLHHLVTLIHSHSVTLVHSRHIPGSWPPVPLVAAAQWPAVHDAPHHHAAVQMSLTRTQLESATPRCHITKVMLPWACGSRSCHVDGYRFHTLMAVVVMVMVMVAHKTVMLQSACSCKAQPGTTVAEQFPPFDGSYHPAVGH